MKNGVEIKSRINKLINAFKHLLLDELLRFLDSTLPLLIQLNLILQLVDPLIYILYDSLFSCTCFLLSRFPQPEIVRKYKRGEISYEEIKVEVMNTANILENERLFVGFLVRGRVNALLSVGTVTERQVQNFYAACLEFDRTAFLCAIKNFSIKDEFLKHVRFLNFYDQKCTFESVLFVAEKLKHYEQFTPQQLNELVEQELLLLQSITLDDLPNDVLEEVAICTDADGNNITYRIDVLWYYLSKDNIPGTKKSKFDNLFKLAKVILCTIHSNAEEEPVFSRVRKSLTPQCANLIRWNIN